MISVAAAALIAGTGFANAQGPGRDAPAAGSAAQQSAPAERAAPSAAPMNRDAGESKGMKGAQTNEKMAPEGSKNLRAQDDAKPGMKGEKSKSMSSETQEKGAASKDMKADSKAATDSKSQTTTQAPAGKDSKSQTTTQAPAAADSKPQTTTQAPTGADSKSQTTGNAATSATAAPPPEKRTQIISAIKSENVPEVSNVNFNISVGVAVPSSVRAYPLPPRIVEIYPEWRGYEVIRVRGQWVIVRPQTRTIVYIIEG
jgi:hypothetical protein